MKFNELKEAFDVKVKTKITGKKLPTRNSTFEFYAEPDKKGFFNVYIKASGKYYKVTYLPADDEDEILGNVNNWIDSKKGDFVSLITKYLNKTYKLGL